ncbi:FAD/NAD(P)-binding protein [Ectothiorhodospiraceae bacterium WFHF3C12]|nr:FAD/NAD(P)-binding protein [Ectothiorhodospiraceae bacterium WFHF3C12]
MLPRSYRIESVESELPGGEVFSWTLRPRGGELEVGQPGQFNMLYQLGIGEVPISISALGEDGTLIHTIRDVGGVTRNMAALSAGEEIGVRGPFGTAWPVAAAEGHDVLLVAGGIGLAPLRPVIHHVLANRERYRRIFLLYGTRQPADILFRKELERWRGRFDIDVAVTVDRADASWRGDVGVVTRLIERGGFDPRNSIAMVCGPEVMMRFAVMSLERRGVPARQIYLSMERNMQCAVGYCGHCQYGGHFICKDGPVFPYDRLEPLFDVREL